MIIFVIVLRAVGIAVTRNLINIPKKSSLFDKSFTVKYTNTC